jgi:hypothetical protein
MGIVRIDLPYTEPVEWLRCPEGCGAMSPKEGLFERTQAFAQQVGYPFKTDRDYSDDELLRINCDMTKRVVMVDGKFQLKAE